MGVNEKADREKELFTFSINRGQSCDKCWYCWVISLPQHTPFPASSSNKSILPYGDCPVLSSFLPQDDARLSITKESSVDIAAEPVGFP